MKHDTRRLFWLLTAFTLLPPAVPLADQLEKHTELIVLDVPDALSAGATGISEHEAVIGLSFSANRQFQVFRWTDATGTQILGTRSTHGPGVPIGPDINRSGASSLSAEVGGWEHAFRWTDEEGLLDIGDVPTTDTYASAINRRGDICGLIRPSLGFPHAFLWTEETGIVDLGTLGGWQSFAMDVNDSDEVVGTSQTPDGLTHAFVWSEKMGLRDLGVPAGYVWSFGEHINNRGEVLGSAADASGNTRPFVWSERDGIIVLRARGSSSVVANAINDHGEVVGAAAIGSAPTRAFIWHRSRGFIDLGTLGGSFAYAWALNDHAEVVGASTSAEGQAIPFVWSRHTGMHSLGITDGSATAINDQGDVVGTVNTAIGQRPFLLRRHLGRCDGGGSHFRAMADRKEGCRRTGEESPLTLGMGERESRLGTPVVTLHFDGTATGTPTCPRPRA